jgi:hypothetical protein
MEQAASLWPHQDSKADHVISAHYEMEAEIPFSPMGWIWGVSPIVESDKRPLLLFVYEESPSPGPRKKRLTC